MADTFEMCDLEATSIDEKCLVNAKVEMLKLSLTQLSKCEEELALKVVRPKMD
jgi:hypothetical protein